MSMTSPWVSAIRSLIRLSFCCSVCALLVAGCGGDGVTSRSLVTPAALPGILARFWQENNRANRAQSVALQDRDEEGSAAAIDNESYVIARAYDAAFHAASPPYQPSSQPFAGGAVWRQRSYPLIALELAPVQYSRCAQALAFVRDSAGAPWRAAVEPLVDAALMPRLRYGGGGFAVPVSPDGRFAVGLRSLAGYLARTMTRYAYMGGRSTALPSAMLPTDVCWPLPDLPDEVAVTEGDGLLDTVSVRPAYGEPLASSTQGEGAFVLLSLDASITFHAPGGRFVTTAVQWIASGEPAYFTVRPGRYRTITFNSGIELAVLDPPAGHDAGVRVIGTYSGLLPGSTTP